jgi:hypothetical protein
VVGGDLSHDRIDMDETVYERYMEALGSEHDRYAYSLRLLLPADVYGRCIQTRRLGVILQRFATSLWFLISIVYDARHSQAVIICNDLLCFHCRQSCPREPTLSVLAVCRCLPFSGKASR